MLKVLFASPEVVPFAKTGGLADVAGSLPAALKNLGCDVRVMHPSIKWLSRRQKSGSFWRRTSKYP